jgi:hypothetical protein
VRASVAPGQMRASVFQRSCQRARVRLIMKLGIASEARTSCSASDRARTRVRSKLAGARRRERGNKKPGGFRHRVHVAHHEFSESLTVRRNCKTKMRGATFVPAARSFTSACAKLVSFDVTHAFRQNRPMSRVRLMSELVAACRLWGGARRRLVAVYRFLRGICARTALWARNSLPGREIPCSGRANSLLGVRKFPARSEGVRLRTPDLLGQSRATAARIFENSLLISLFSGNSPRRGLSSQGPREPHAHVTHVLGTFCHPCVRAGHRGNWRAREDSNL